MFGKESKGNIELLLFDVYISFYSVFFFLTAWKYSIKKISRWTKKKESPSDADEQSIQKTTD